LPRRASVTSGRVVQCVGESRYFDDAAGRSRPQHAESHRRRPSAEAHSVAVCPRSSWSSGQCEVEQLHPRPPAAVTTPAPLPDRHVFPPPIPPQITPPPWTLPTSRREELVKSPSRHPTLEQAACSFSAAEAPRSSISYAPRSPAFWLLPIIERSALQCGTAVIPRHRVRACRLTVSRQRMVASRGRSNDRRFSTGHEPDLTIRQSRAAGRG
jgi:hypothetical protein